MAHESEHSAESDAPACNGECLIASDPAGIPTGGIAVPDPACPAHGTRVTPPGEGVPSQDG